jgi:hypothetical protein
VARKQGEQNGAEADPGLSKDGAWSREHESWEALALKQGVPGISHHVKGSEDIRNAFKVSCDIGCLLLNT